MPRSRRAARSQAPLKLLGADDIVGSSDTVYEIVEVPEWGGRVRVRGLTARERDDFELSLVYIAPNGQQRQNLSGAREKLVARGMVDENGERLIADGDATKLSVKSARAMERVFDTVRRLSGMTDVDVEKIVGNSNGDRSAATS